MPNQTIQCICGEVKLEITGEPLMHFYCHCDDCQAAHGAPMVGTIVFPADAVKVAGDPLLWSLMVTPRATCTSCGTRVYMEPPGYGIIGVVSSLFPPGAFQPAWHQMCRFSSVQVRDELPHYAGYPTVMGGSDHIVDW
jgi:hypothetical protein